MVQPCPSCGQQLLVQTKTCSYCGVDLPQVSTFSPVSEPNPQSVMIGQPQMANPQQPVIINNAQPQQIVYIPLKFSPKPNWRIWSYLVIAVGILISVIASVFNAGSMESGGPMFLSNSVCCISISVAAFMDAAYYSTKSNWEQSTGQSNTGSKIGMVFDIVFGLIALFFVSVFIFGYASIW